MPAWGLTGPPLPPFTRRAGLVHLEGVAQPDGLEPSGLGGPTWTGQPSSPCTSGGETDTQRRGATRLVPTRGPHHQHLGTSAPGQGPCFRKRSHVVNTA